MGKQKLITIYNIAMQIQVRKLLSLTDSQCEKFQPEFNFNLQVDLNLISYFFVDYFREEFLPSE